MHLPEWINVLFTLIVRNATGVFRTLFCNIHPASPGQNARFANDFEASQEEQTDQLIYRNITVLKVKHSVV